MKVLQLNDMVKGWFVGDFDPVALRSTEAEVAYKEYKQGDKESAHLHKIATEVTVIAYGRVEMNGKTYNKGSIIIMEPSEATDFLALEDCATVVVKLPSVKGDKYPI